MFLERLQNSKNTNKRYLPLPDFLGGVLVLAGCCSGWAVCFTGLGFRVVVTPPPSCKVKRALLACTDKKIEKKQGISNKIEVYTKKGMKSYMFVFTQPFQHRQDVTQGQFISRFEFRVFLILDWLLHQSKRTQSALLLTHSWGRRDGFMPFSRWLKWSKMQTASSRIWSLVTDSISYNNRYVKQSPL